jgi:hypothetical protein
MPSKAPGILMSVNSKSMSWAFRAASASAAETALCTRWPASVNKVVQHTGTNGASKNSSAGLKLPFKARDPAKAVCRSAGC